MQQELGQGRKGTVSIFILKDDRKEFYKYIYDPFLMGKTLDILKPIKGPIKESEILELNNKYFKAVKMGMGDEKSKENLACLSQLSFQDLSKKFKLIEEDYPKVNVFVELDETAAEIWKKYQDMRMEKDLKERIRKKLEIRKEFSEYVISAPEKYRSFIGRRRLRGWIHIKCGTAQLLRSGNGLHAGRSRRGLHDHLRSVDVPTILTFPHPPPLGRAHPHARGRGRSRHGSIASSSRLQRACPLAQAYG